MILFAGLGNPGQKYERHRHNVGFMAVERIRQAFGFGPERNRFQGLASEGMAGGVKALALKPMTYMNESGRSIGAAQQFYKLSSENIIVFHDELDLPPGKLRVKAGGGHAGHNGLRSIVRHIGADFRRVRIGIDHPGDKNRVHRYVLSDFAKSDSDWLDALLESIGENAGFLAKGDDAGFMNRVAIDMRGKEPGAKVENKD